MMPLSFPTRQIVERATAEEMAAFRRLAHQADEAWEKYRQTKTAEAGVCFDEAAIFVERWLAMMERRLVEFLN